MICNVWGVVHNGVDAFQPAIDAIRRFRAQRGPAVLLSNAPRLADGVEAQFERLGIPLDFYDGIVTSGSVARDDLIRRLETVMNSRCSISGLRVTIRCFTG